MGPGNARDIGRPTAQDFYAADVQQIARRQLDATEVRGLETRFEASAQRPPHSLGLVADFLAHVVVERALVVSLVFPDER